MTYEIASLLWGVVAWWCMGCLCVAAIVAGAWLMKRVDSANPVPLLMMVFGAMGALAAVVAFFACFMDVAWPLLEHFGIVAPSPEWEGADA